MRLKLPTTAFLVATGISLQAFTSGYVWQFNLDENLAGADVAIEVTNWHMNYGPTAIYGDKAANTGLGNGIIVSGNSEGNTGGTAKPLQQFSNNDRGFMFGSGAGDSTTGFAPAAMFFWTTNLTTVNVVQGAKASGTWETDWMTPAFPPTEALGSLTLGDLIEISVQTLPRNADLEYRMALRINGTWYVDAVAYKNAAPLSWKTYSLSIQTATLYPLPFTPEVELDVDVTDNTSVTVASLDPDSPITGYGVYVDTGAFKGTSNVTGSWARFDAFYIKAPVAPPVQTVAVGAGSFSVEIDTMTGVSYQLRRDTDPAGSFATAAGSPASGNGGTITLSDPDYGTVGADKVFYIIDAQVE